jgi:hypothetical protein
VFGLDNLLQQTHRVDVGFEVDPGVPAFFVAGKGGAGGGVEGAHGRPPQDDLPPEVSGYDADGALGGAQNVRAGGEGDGEGREPGDCNGILNFLGIFQNFYWHNIKVLLS